MHGAGLNKQMFMRPDGIVFEISAHLNDSQMPLCGYFGNMAYIFGHHHYLFAYNGDNGSFNPPREVETMNETDVVQELLKYYNYMHSDKSAEMRKPFIEY